MIALVNKGLPRLEAHKLLQQLVFDGQEKNKGFAEVLETNPVIAKYLTKENIKSALNPKSYLGLSGELVDAAVGKTVAERKRRGLLA